MNSDYMKDLEIDLNDLHHECIKQPQLFMKYAELSAISEKREMRAKQKLAIVESELDNKHRQILSNKDIKVTEKMVLSEIKQDKEYLEANKEYMDACFENNIYSNAKTAFQDRKSQLQNLAQLFCASYFAKPNTKTKTDTAQQKQRDNLKGEQQ